MDFRVLKDQVDCSPAFVINTDALENNLLQLNALRQQSGCKVLYSVKALPLTKILQIAKPFVDGFSVSSLFEAQLAHKILGTDGSLHITTPGLRTDEWHDLSPILSHISFNSLTQYQRFLALGIPSTSVGLRVNPKHSFLSDERFDPCRSHSKLGVNIDDLLETNILKDIKGLHIHTAFSATDFTSLINTVDKLRHYFGHRLAQLDWINLGGGYLFKDIKNHQPLIDLINHLKQDYTLNVFIEPGKAIVDDTGYLVTTVLDIFISDGKTVAILDTSVNHHPEVFEYQRRLDLHEHQPHAKHSAILAGSSCLAGDIFGEYQFAEPLKVGDKLVFKNVGAYSLIKANRFNGYNLPTIYSYQNQQFHKEKQYHFADYCQQWSTD